MADITFEQVKILIEQMPSVEVERLREWLNSAESEQSMAQSNDTSWGQHLVALVNQFDLDKGDQMDISDPEAWVREHRRTQTQRRNPGWGAE